MGKHSLDLGENTPRWIPSIKNPDKPADYLNYDHFIRAYPHLEKFLTRHQGDRFEDIDWWMYVNAPNAKMGTKNYNIGRVPKSDAALAEHQRLYAEKLRQKQTSSAAEQPGITDFQDEEGGEDVPGERKRFPDEAVIKNLVDNFVRQIIDAFLKKGYTYTNNKGNT